MERTSRQTGEATVYRIVGKVDLLTSPKLQASIESVITGDRPRLLLDMREVTYISSAGLRVILAIAKQVAAAKGGLAVFGLQAAVNEVFQISGLQNVIPISTDEAQARASLEAKA